MRLKLLTKAEAKEIHGYLDLKIRLVENQLSKWIRDYIKGEEYKGIIEWLRKQKGVGPILAAGIIAGTYSEGRGIERFENPSKYLRYWGLAVIEGRAERWHKGEKGHFNPFLKALAFKISSSFVRVGEGGRWRQVYDWYKARETMLHASKHPGCKYPDGHIEMMSRRYAVKQFIIQLWLYWRRLERLSVTAPYPHRLDPRWTAESKYFEPQPSKPEEKQIKRGKRIKKAKKPRQA